MAQQFKKLKDWRKLKQSLKKFSATQTGQYSWVTKIQDGEFVFTIKIGHKNKEINLWKSLGDWFYKKIDVLGIENSYCYPTVRYYKELYNTINKVFDKKAQLLYGTDKRARNKNLFGQIKKIVIEKNYWKMAKISDDLSKNSKFILEHIK